MAHKISRLRKNNKDLLIQLIKTNFKLRYSDSVLGVLWVLMKPLLEFVVLLVVFSSFRQGFSDSGNYAANLMIGLVIFNFLREGVIAGSNSLVTMSNIILKVDFPRDMAVLSSVTIALVNFFINILIVIGLVAFKSFVPDLLGSIYFFGLMIMLYFLVYGVSLFVSVIVIRIRDLENIIQVGFQLVFWGSGIFYDVSKLDGTLRTLVELNPIAVLIDASRSAIIYGEYTHLEYIGLLLVATIIIFITGRIFFEKNVKKIAEHF